MFGQPVIFYHNNQDSILSVQAILEVARVSQIHRCETKTQPDITNINRNTLILIGLEIRSLKGMINFRRVVIIDNSKTTDEFMDVYPPNFTVHVNQKLSVGQNMASFIFNNYKLNSIPRSFWIIDILADRETKLISLSEEINTSLEANRVIERIQTNFTGTTKPDPLTYDCIDIHGMFGINILRIKRDEIEREISRSTFSNINFKGLTKPVWISTSTVHWKELVCKLQLIQEASCVCFCDFNIITEMWSIHLFGNDSDEISKRMGFDSSPFELTWNEFDRTFSRKAIKCFSFFAKRTRDM